MPTLPWTTVEPAPADTEVVLMASRFQLRSLWQVPRFLADAMRIRKQVLAAPGAVGVSLIAQPFRRTFFTLSAWRDRPSLNALVGAEPHRSAMLRHRKSMQDAHFVFWTASGDAMPPTWSEAQQRLAETAGTDTGPARPGQDQR
jgi:hypothetical protein